MAADRDGLAVVLDALERAGRQVKHRGNAAMAQCPAHDDSTASLSVSAGRDQPVVLQCHGGCDADLVLDALGLSWADISNPRPKPNTIVATYDYVDESGGPLFQVCRLDPKSFRQRRPDGAGGWTWGLGDTRRVLYNLPAVVQAINAGEPVFIVEGEKDADRLQREGVTATCNAMGAGKWHATYTEALAGADVIIVADRDTAGRAHAAQIAAQLDGVAASITCCEPRDGKDTSDHLNAGHAIDDLVVIDDAWAIAKTDDAPPEPEALSEPESTSIIDRLRSRLLVGLTAIRSIPPRSPLVADLLDLDSFVVLYGRPGSGKSFLAIDLALCIATGSWWHKHPVTDGHVLYLFAEGAAGIPARTTAWTTLNRYDGNADRFVALPASVNLLDVAERAALVRIASELHPVLVIIDTLNRSTPGADENSSKDMGLVIQAADQIRAATGACVLIVHHSGKDSSAGARGHSSLLGAVDTELEVKNAGDGIITLATTKQKDHGEQPSMRFVLVPAADSVAVAPYTGRNPAGDDTLSASARSVLAALTDVDAGTGVSCTVWRETAAADHGVQKSAFYKALKQLVAHGMVRVTGTDHRPIYSPTTRDNA